eukprot:CCRYP_017583-RA/>CCRYP_017583-RA protein AED:0.22 eAED:0.22 QI:107/1/1/1/1/1/3/311/70
MASNPSSSFKNPFSSGLGRRGRLAAWVTAIGVVAAWNYYESGEKTSESFTNEEQESWNAQKKALADQNNA